MGKIINNLRSTFLLKTKRWSDDYNFARTKNLVKKSDSWVSYFFQNGKNSINETQTDSQERHSERKFNLINLCLKFEKFLIGIVIFIAFIIITLVFLWDILPIIYINEIILQVEYLCKLHGYSSEYDILYSLLQTERKHNDEISVIRTAILTQHSMFHALLRLSDISETEELWQYLVKKESELFSKRLDFLQVFEMEWENSKEFQKLTFLRNAGQSKILFVLSLVNCILALSVAFLERFVKNRKR